jgi:UPF0755 protein
MKRKNFLSIFAVLILLAGFSAWKIFGPTVKAPADKFFYIKTGSSFLTMKDELLKAEIIRSSFWFDKTVSLLRFKQVKAGKFLISEGMSLYQLIQMLKSGKQTTVNLVITKSRLKEDLARKFDKLFEFDSIQAMQFINNTDSLKEYNLDTNTMMAAVLPDTYTYYWNSTPKKVFQKLYQQWQKFWNDERKSKANNIGLTPIQVSTLASIIDEESNYSPEKGNIASVYLNRLQKKMPLQADPTVKFALKDFKLKRVYQKHLATKSAFNTYINTGLPPGPICTPQRETIDAVLNAPKTDYLYFVAKSDFSGSHVFTSNYADHLKKAKEYQQALNKQEAIRKTNQ